jgi:probable HAF family extracellular repeat protein
LILSFFVLVVASSVGALLSSSAGARATAYRATDLGVLPGGASSWGYAINNAGQAVGYGDTSTGTLRAVLWERGKAIELGALPGAESCMANGINASGAVVGLCSGSFGTHAVLWTGGKTIDLGVLDEGGDYSFAAAVNDSGRVVGSALQTSGILAAVVWENGTARRLAELPDQVGGFAIGINNAGQIVGQIFGKTDGLSWGHAVIWENGTVTDLGALGGTSAWANAINSRGQIAAIRLTPSEEAVLVYRGTVARLDTPPAEAGKSSALAINNRGQIAGFGQTFVPFGAYAAVWDTDGTRTELPPLSNGVAGAYGLNERGQVVGTSFFGDGHSHAVLWVKNG